MQLEKRPEQLEHFTAYYYPAFLDKSEALLYLTVSSNKRHAGSLEIEKCNINSLNNAMITVTYNTVH